MKNKKDTKPILSSNLFPVVGIGASAGGLNAFKKLIKAIPENSGIAFVLVQHLDPTHESMLPDLLQKVTKIPVLEISDDIKVKPDHIYIIPSNKMLLANDGVLELSPRPPKSKLNLHMPIDVFFNSLAEVHRAHSIGVVLSGSASDGTKGLKAIKDHGGITFAQDEESATFEGMPQSAKLAGVVDFILPPELIPLKIVELLQEVKAETDVARHPAREPKAPVVKILEFLRLLKGTDFTYYKQSTIRRRIKRRMASTKTETESDYLTLLQSHSTEQNYLFQSLLIPVTSFFRDEKTFDYLCSSVLPHIMSIKDPDEALRIWVAGCSTGQEVYSIAMCIKEIAGEKTNNIKIFATDISEPSLQKARSGIYKKVEVRNISQRRLDLFFSVSNGNYVISKKIREICVFARHDFLKDPPFIKMDLICCRNVLIYMEPYLQKKALTSFHFALKEKGFLLLGHTESIHSVDHILKVFNYEHKIFTRTGDIVSVATDVVPAKTQRDKDLHLPVRENPAPGFRKIIDDLILKRFSSPGVIVNDSMDIIFFRGNTSLYLSPAEGKPIYNLSAMAKTGLAFELRNILHKAKKINSTGVKNDIPLHENGIHRLVSIEAIPLENLAEPHFLVLFHEMIVDSELTERINENNGSQHTRRNKYVLRIHQLESEFVQTREDMRTITEYQETANRDLQSANEELLSRGEELQSLNDELETSKEDLQNTNEELTVVNQELVGLNKQIVLARDFAEAIITTVRTPLLVLDKSLRIKSVNNAFCSFFRFTKSEVEGILIYELGNKEWNISSFKKLLQLILNKGKPMTGFEVRADFPAIGSKILLLNASRIVTGADEEKLLLLAIEDITEEISFRKKEKEFQQELEGRISERTLALNEANEELQQKNQEIALSMYNRRFLTEFSERFSANEAHLEFFNSLVLYIADLIKLDYVLVAKIIPVRENEFAVSTIAMTVFGSLSENIIYPLSDGPCAEITRGVLCSYPENCRILFPDSKTLLTYRVEGYIGYPLFDPMGTAIGLIAVMHEKKIDDPVSVSSILKIVAKRAEMELERIKVEEQLLENNKILEEKNEDLLQVNKELESFTHISSHDLQEPLRKIQIFANRILEKELDRLSDSGKDFFNRIRQSALQMQTLIQDLLIYSQASVAERVFEIVNLQDVVTAAISELGEIIREKEAVIDSKDLCLVKINATQFQQVMINLIGNALKFSSVGKSPHITIRSKILEGNQLEEENPSLTPGKLSQFKLYCHISIADNGIGFDPKYGDQIFEVFERLYGKNEYPGTGIGLAIVRKIIGNHDGFIFARGELNKGATFDIYIPQDR